jgi:hypothetical protein
MKIILTVQIKNGYLLLNTEYPLIKLLACVVNNYSALIE